MRKTIALSTHLDVERKKLEKEGILDVSLGIDTKYFLDPRLLFSVSDLDDSFSSSCDKVLDYFKKLIKVIKSSEDSDQLQKIAVDMIAIQEPKGLSIGYGSERDSGASIPESVARRIIYTVAELIKVGIDDPELIELMVLFIDKYGPDSISDLLVHIIYEDLCNFTQKKCKKLKLKTKKFTINGKKFFLPQHPFKDHQIVFVPLEFLSPLPVACDWESVKDAAAHNEKLRKEFGSILMPIIKEQLAKISELDDKEKIVIKESFKKLIKIFKNTEPESYNISLDPKGYYRAQGYIEEYAKKFTAQKTELTDCKEMVEFVKRIIESFKNQVEDMGNSNLLYHRTKTHAVLKDKPHREDVPQMIFHGIVDVHCSYTNVLHSRESKNSAGPVDFTAGTSRTNKVVVEIKKSTNDIVKGYKKQTPLYQKGEKACHAFYVVIIVKDEKPSKRKPITDVEELQDLYEKNKKEGIISPEVIFVDGLIYPSPSK